MLTRLLAIGVAVLATYLAITGIFGPRGLLALNGVRNEVLQLEAENAALDADVNALSEQVERLRTSDTAIEEVAREEHGFTRAGEVIYQFEEEP